MRVALVRRGLLPTLPQLARVEQLGNVVYSIFTVFSLTLILLPSEILRTIYLVMASSRRRSQCVSDTEMPFFHESSMRKDLPPRVKAALDFFVPA